MKLCRNCRTVNSDEATQCVRCKIKDQLTPYNPEMTKNWQDTMHKKIKIMRPSNICRNCGSPDEGQAQRCPVCHFPLRRVHITDESLLKNKSSSSNK